MDKYLIGYSVLDTILKKHSACSVVLDCDYFPLNSEGKVNEENMDIIIEDAESQITNLVVLDHHKITVLAVSKLN